MSTDEPADSDRTAALNDAITLWATPGLIDHPDHGSLCPAGAGAQHRRANQRRSPRRQTDRRRHLVLLGSGFGLLARLEPAELAELPVLEQWHAKLGYDGRVLRIIEPAGTFYDGDLGPQPPLG